MSRHLYLNEHVRRQAGKGGVRLFSVVGVESDLCPENLALLEGSLHRWRSPWPPDAWLTVPFRATALSRCTQGGPARVLAGFGARISPTLCCTGGVTCVAGWDGFGRESVRSLLPRAPRSSRRPRSRGVGGCWTVLHQTQGIHATTLSTRCLLRQAHVSALVYAL